VYDIGSRGSLASITVTNGGSGYTSAPTVTIDAPPSGPYAGQATATATYATSTVYSFSSITTTVTNGGTGYTSDVTVTSPTIPYGSYSFVATATTGGGQQVSVEVPDVITINDTSCSLGESCTIASGSGFQQQIVPPISGQYVILYPTVTTSGGTGWTTSDEGGLWVDPPTCVGATDGSAVWSTPVLPSYVLPANVTAIYAISITSNYLPGNPGGYSCYGQPYQPNTGSGVSLTVSATGITPLSLLPSGNQWSPVQTTVLLSGLTGANFSSAIINGTGSASVGLRMGETFNNYAAYIVYYTGTAPPENTGTTVVAPLNVDPVTQDLSISPLAEFPGSALVPTRIVSLPGASNSTGWIVPVTDGASSTDCTAGGGTNYVQCYGNGSTWSAYTPQLGTLASLNVSGAISAGSVQAGSLQDSGAASTSGSSCLQINTAGVISNTGSGCGGSGGSVTQIIAGSNITVSPTGGTGNVTISATGGSSSGLLSGANVIFTGDSLMIDDSGNTLGATTTATAINCNSTGICTVVDSQSYAAGQWVFLGTSGISPACIGTLNSEGYYGTGNRIYQVLSAGLSSTQFEVQTNGCISTSGTGGTVEDASYFMPVQTAAGPAFKNVNAWYLRNGVDSASIYGGMTGLVEEQATNFSAMYGDLLPSVTGKPLYLLEESAGINDIAVNVTESVIEASFQSFWSQAHAAGAYVVQNLIPQHSNATTTADLNTWLIAQGKNASNAASGQYWDYAGVDMRVFGSFGNPPSTQQISLASQAWNAALEAAGTSGFTLSNCNVLTDCAALAGTNFFTGSNYFTGNNAFNVSSQQGLVVGDYLGYGDSITLMSTVLPKIRVAGSGYDGTDSYPGTFIAFYNYGGTDGTTNGINMNAAPLGGGWCFESTPDDPENIRPDTCMTRSQTNAGEVDFGNGSAPGDMSGTIGSNAIIGPATAPSGSCSVNGRWVFSQDGHATFCASGTWVTKI
jgi:hypothetical protein